MAAVTNGRPYRSIEASSRASRNKRSTEGNALRELTAGILVATFLLLGMLDEKALVRARFSPAGYHEPASQR
jgi:hypothetical protein